MIDPCAYWTRVMSAWGSVGATGERLGETATASQAVIASRTNTIGAAMRSPLSGDYAELGRMVPEKVAAFSASVRCWRICGVNRCACSWSCTPRSVPAETVVVPP